ncbi:histidine phosphatase family protein [Blastococcus sp. CT_GayMR16]|uniref:SixA phosphatase family protein n=1 Tax=Blastococcus sp. CT_GayMR16 TaxID=2559607 RepID=UPI0010740FDD|nr:histidine phosphatase family protein [Blastococcus sp. CT_GayMR16]TFV88584.1 phosphohistidine phosphatase [Blastococcus sp. CT_GayMR16]
MQPRRLLLVRHAQAADAPVDADRPLTERGSQHASAIGSWLKRAGLAPDRAVVSPAVRAAQTWERAGAGVAPGLPPVVDARIYENTVEALLAVIQEIPDDVATLAVIGHNPSIGVLASILDDGEGSPAARRDLSTGFPTGGVAVFVLAAAFAALAPGTATLTDFTVPGG